MKISKRMPHFLIIGAARAGTSALRYYINQHPQVYMSPIVEPAREPRFFAFEGQELNFQGPGDEDMNNSITDLLDYQALFNNVSDEKAIGEKSAVYIYIKRSAEKIRHYVPNIKLIASLRNPVERAYSSFIHMINGGREQLTNFEQALIEEGDRIKRNYGPGWHYVKRGFYYESLKHYHDLFGKDQLKVILYDDFYTDPVAVVKSIFYFLEVDETFVPNMSFRPNVSAMPKHKIFHIFLKRNSTFRSIVKNYMPKKFERRVISRLDKLYKWNSIRPRMSTETRNKLIEIYRDDILKTQGLIQRDLSGWLQ